MKGNYLLLPLPAHLDVPMKILQLGPFSIVIKSFPFYYMTTPQFY